jgi:hypothetical protein
MPPVKQNSKLHELSSSRQVLCPNRTSAQSVISRNLAVLLSASSGRNTASAGRSRFSFVEIIRSQLFQAPGGAGPGPLHRGKKTLNALCRHAINVSIRTPGRNETIPTGVLTTSDEAIPTAVSKKELLRQAPIPPPSTARAWSISQKRLACAQKRVGRLKTGIAAATKYSVPVRTRNSPVTPAKTIKTQAAISIL